MMTVFIYMTNGDVTFYKNIRMTIQLLGQLHVMGSGKTLLIPVADIKAIQHLQEDE